MSENRVEDATGGNVCPVLEGYNPMLPEELDNPYPSLARARQEAPVFFSPEFGMWSVTRQEDVLAVLRDPSFSASRALAVPPPPDEVELASYPWKRSVLLLDEPEHRPMRSLIQAPFTPRSLADRVPIIRQRAEELLQPLRTEGQIEFVNGYAFPLSLSVIGSITGVPAERYDELKRAVEASFHVMNAGIAGSDHEQMVRAAEDIRVSVDYIKELIADRRERPQDDYTSAMVHRVHADGSPVTDDEVVTGLFDLLIAGFETTAQMMAHGVRALLSHPDQWELLKGDPALVEQAVEEMLRYQTLVKRIFRVATRDVEIGGVVIPEGSLVAMVLASANHDESVYDDAERFDIRRERNDHLAFGKWTHFCVGAPLARLELRTTVEALLGSFPDVRLVEDGHTAGPPDIRIHTIGRMTLAT